MAIGKSTANTVVLTRNGSLRISSDLLPEGATKELYYSVVGYPDKKKIELRPTTATETSFLIRKASFSNGGARSPLVAVRQVLGNIGVALPNKVTSCEVHRKKDGTLIIQF